MRLTLVRTDGKTALREVGLARPADRPEAIRPLLALKLGAIDAGFGIEVLRLEAWRSSRSARASTAASSRWLRPPPPASAGAKPRAWPTFSAGSARGSGSRR